MTYKNSEWIIRRRSERWESQSRVCSRQKCMGASMENRCLNEYNDSGDLIPTAAF